MKFYYLLLDILSVAFPVGGSFYKPIAFHKKWHALFPAMSVMWLIYLPWDVLFSYWGVWGFNEKYLVGLDILYLPIEEWLFFLLITYACVFIYESVVMLAPKWSPQNVALLLFKVLGPILLVIGLVLLDKMYTSLTFTLCGIFLVYLSWISKPRYLGRFLVAYGFMLIPFLIVNGALTGGFTPEPVVWYNHAENLGIRLYTIPIEDSIYLMLMMLIVIDVYEKILNRI